ncbi:hypothetical protein OKW34_007168 [Paraburkholderia youngii]
MYANSTRGGRQDEWGELVLIVMKTSLAVAHELELAPDAVSRLCREASALR